MTSIVAANPPVAPPGHPGWCAAHVPTDDGPVLHISAEQRVTGTYGLERSEMYVSIEQTDVPMIRLDGSGPMTPLQAMQLAAVLQTAALAVLLEREGGAA